MKNILQLVVAFAIGSALPLIYFSSSQQSAQQKPERVFAWPMFQFRDADGGDLAMLTEKCEVVFAPGQTCASLDAAINPTKEVTEARARKKEAETLRKAQLQAKINAATKK